MSEKLESFFDYCKNFILDHIDDYEGQTFYACDLGYEITQDINVNGTCTFSTYQAKQYIKEWWDEAGDYLEYEKIEFGQNSHNPFESPEAFMVCMVITGVERIIYQCETIDEGWSNVIELTQDVIKKIKREVEEVTSIEF